MYVVRVRSQQLVQAGGAAPAGFLTLVLRHQLGGHSTFMHIATATAGGGPEPAAASGVASGAASAAAGRAAGGATGSGGGGERPGDQRIATDISSSSSGGGGLAPGLGMETGCFGQLLHMRAGDCLSLQRRCPVPADTPAMVPMTQGVELSVELAMRQDHNMDSWTVFRQDGPDHLGLW